MVQLGSFSIPNGGVDVQGLTMSDKSGPGSFQMRAEVAPFQPTPGAMSFLNADSTPDTSGPASASSSAFSTISRPDPCNKGKAPIRPIGSRTSLTGQATMFGPPFTTDGDANFSGSRFVKYTEIPHAWVAYGNLAKALDQACPV